MIRENTLKFVSIVTSIRPQIEVTFVSTSRMERTISRA